MREAARREREREKEGGERKKEERIQLRVRDTGFKWVRERGREGEDAAGEKKM